MLASLLVKNGMLGVAVCVATNAGWVPNQEPGLPSPTSPTTMPPSREMVLANAAGPPTPAIKPEGLPLVHFVALVSAAAAPPTFIDPSSDMIRLITGPSNHSSNALVPLLRSGSADPLVPPPVHRIRGVPAPTSPSLSVLPIGGPPRMTVPSADICTAVVSLLGRMSSSSVMASVVVSHFAAFQCVPL